MINEPLGIPKGSIRAIIAIIFSIGLVIGLILKLEKVDVLIAITSTIVGYYFSERAKEQIKEIN
jgi:hypothetical protein